MKIVGVLEWLLLVTLKYSEETCTKDVEKKWYFIYNTTVEVDAYYCSYSDEDDVGCRNSDNVETRTDYSYFLQKCKGNLFIQQSRLQKHEGGTAKVCKISARVKDAVIFSDKMSCQYDQKMCYDKKSRPVFWNDINICTKIFSIRGNTFTSWNNEQQQRFIQDVDINLLLTEKFKFCDIEVWRTNYDEIIVSSKKLNDKLNTSQLMNLQSDFREFCENRQYITNTTKTWYIYKYPTSITTYTCHKNIQTSCEDKNYGETVPDNQNLSNQCMNNFCNMLACRTRSKFTLCKRTQVYLEINKQLPPECKYSDGICKSLNMFWEYTDLCQVIEKVYEAYETKCWGRKCVTENINNTKLKLLEKRNLCGKTVWSTDKNELVASQEELEFSVSNTSLSPHQDNDQKDQILMPSGQVDDQDDTGTEKIDYLVNSVRYLVFILAACCLWYVFNVLVNFSSLRKLNKTRSSEKKVSLLNCLSDGLTVYHLSSNQREKKSKQVVSNVQTPQLYESVENELYNKSTRVNLKR